MSDYTAIVQNEGDCWIGWIEELPGVNCQEATRDELLETLRITLRRRSRATVLTRDLRHLNTSRKFASLCDAASARPLARCSRL